MPKPPTQGASPTVAKTQRSGWQQRGASPSSIKPKLNGKHPPVLDAMKPAQLTLLGEPPKRAPFSRAETTPIARITDEAVEAYNRILAKPHGLLAQVTPVSIPRRRDQVKRCLPTAKLICEEHYGSEEITQEFWEAYFTEIKNDDFRSGRRLSTNPAHSNWRPDFEWLLHPRTMTKVFEEAVS